MAEGGARESSLCDSHNFPLLELAPVGGRAQGGFYLVPQMFIVSHSFGGSGVQKWLSCMVQAQGLSSGCSQVVGQGCSHLKA